MDGFKAESELLTNKPDERNYHINIKLINCQLFLKNLNVQILIASCIIFQYLELTIISNDD